MLRHKSMVINAHAVAVMNTHDYHACVLSFLPLCHVYERVCNYMYQILGGTIYYAGSLATIGKDLKDIHAMGFCAVPRVLEMMFDKLQAAGKDLKGVKKTIYSWAFRIAQVYDNERTGMIYRLRYKIADKFHASVYFRNYSTYAQGTGYDYSEVDVDSALVELTAAADSLHLLDFARTPLDKEDKKRSRWMVEICYSSGAKVEIVEYIDSAPTADAPVVAALEPIFKRLASKASQPGAFREYSRTSYKPDGKWQRRIHYDYEGRVCGGEDADEPDLEF